MTAARRDRLLVVIIACVLAALAFLFRFNALGGSLGGFDNEEFATLTRVDMVLDGQQPYRDFVDSELRAVWPSLSFEVPAVAQRIWGRNLFVYGCVTLGALALCAALVFIVSRAMSRAWLVAILAGLTTVLSMTVSYNYQKVMPLTIAVVACYWVLSRPVLARLPVLSAVTVIAGLYRHDYGVYVAIASIAGLIGLEPRPWRVAARRVAIYLACGLLFSIPSLIWVERYGGIVQYVRDGLVDVRVDTLSNPPLGLSPRFDWNDLLGTNSLLAFNYYSYWLMTLAAVVVLAVRWAQRRRGERDLLIGMGTALVAMTPIVNYLFLRSHLQARFGDGVVPMAVVGPWIVGAGAAFQSQAARLVTSVGPPVLLALMCTAFLPINSIPHELETGRFGDSASAVLERFGEVKHELQALPPSDWTGRDAPDTLSAARYLAECTEPNDYVLIATYADEVPYYARRHFASGQAYFAFSFLRSEAYQRLALERLARQSVPVALTWPDYKGEIVKNYPLLAHYLDKHYHQVGMIDAHGSPFVRVWVANDRTPRRTDPRLGFPCFR
jgi:hypothetical protein